MLTNIWNTVLYEPLLNALAFLVSIVPGGNVGLAVIALTILVKVFLFPLSQKSIESQAKMTILTPEIDKIKKSGASKEEQAKQTFDLYKKHKTNPFSGCLLVLIQIPIIFALYYVFYKGIKFDAGMLYFFVPVPEHLNMFFLGVDLAGKSIILAVLAGVSQFFQARLMPKPTVNTANDGSFQASFAKSMQVQMKYVFPFLVAFIAYSVSGAIALYWIVSNMFAIGQQVYSNYKNKENNNKNVKTISFTEK
ncbi:MAG: Membrane protein insertase YidC [Candidatus Nomurabacteria bacterium GW2011_GWA2_40_9]|uniref:Membrane protein insertase YidC n=1 Tax=Candidatus Nomurabacteria bacterium GW2011_GWA2_40_9 TaxID=1618734 RepID=A0A0G0TY59_9BACT|nr:MAG: Membrane protein insertase YidC [Candidatus Nomurabacteria bacterium GW2011_GWA2_40_9]